MPKQIQQKSSENIYYSRRTKILKQIRGEVALFPAAERKNRSGDQSYPFTQEANFFYLTGFTEEDGILLLSGLSKGPRSVLYLRDRNPLHEKWDGERLGIKRAKRRFKVDEVRNIETFAHDLPSLIRGAKVLHYAPGINNTTDLLVWKLMQTTVAPRYTMPNVLKDSRLMLAEMRFIKDKHEIAILRHAADITGHALCSVVPRLAKMKSESHCARVIEENFSQLGASGSAFSTTVAAGKNATVLHHRPELTPLWKRGLVLIDTGASYRGYTSDISRTFPVGGRFSAQQAQVYDIVLRAKVEAEKRALPGYTLDQVHDAAVRELAKGLIELGILQGPPSEIIAEGKHRAYFPHRTSHYLGIDVHDIVPLRDAPTPYAIPLAPGNVITIEPGLYFDPKDENTPFEIRGLGIRLEDTVLITANGPDILTGSVPLARAEIEALMSQT